MLRHHSVVPRPRIGTVLHSHRVGAAALLSFFVLTGDLFAQDESARSPRERRGFPQVTPSLAREITNEEFAKKLNLTEKQKELITELARQRTEYIRTAVRAAQRPSDVREELQAKGKEFEDKFVAILTQEQKAIWEQRLEDIKQNPAIAQSSLPPIASERSRIQALETELASLKAELKKRDAEMEKLKAEVERLKAALAK